VCPCDILPLALPCRVFPPRTPCNAPLKPGPMLSHKSAHEPCHKPSHKSCHKACHKPRHKSAHEPCHRPSHKSCHKSATHTPSQAQLHGPKPQAVPLQPQKGIGSE